MANTKKAAEGKQENAGDWKTCAHGHKCRSAGLVPFVGQDEKNNDAYEKELESYSFMAPDWVAIFGMI